MAPLTSNPTRRGKVKLYQNLIKAALLASFAMQVLAAQCFTRQENLMPLVLSTGVSPSLAVEQESYTAIVGCDWFIVYGGSISNTEFIAKSSTHGRTGNVATVSLMDFQTGVVRYQRQYDIVRSDDADIRVSRYTNGLSLKPDFTEVAVYTSKSQYEGDQFGYIFVIWASDGTLKTQTAVEISHSSQANIQSPYRLATSDSIYFNNNGKVLLAFSLYTGTSAAQQYLSECPESGGPCYQRMRLASYNADWTGSLDYYVEQSELFGATFAIVYNNWDGTDENIFIGGHADNNREKNQNDEQNWDLAIYQLEEKAGEIPTKKELWKLRISDSITRSTTLPYGRSPIIDHMKLFLGQSTDYLYGTTQNALQLDNADHRNHMVFVWRVSLKGKTDHMIDKDAPVYLKKLQFLNTPETASTGIVIGISNSLEGSDDQFDLIYQVQSGDHTVYYMSIDLSSGATQAQAIPLYKANNRVYAVAFAGIYTETRQGHTVKQAYIAGQFSKFETSSQVYDFASNSVGLIVPTLPSYTCLKELSTGVLDIQYQDYSGSAELINDLEKDFFSLSLYQSGVTFMMAPEDLNLENLSDQSWCKTFDANTKNFQPPVISDLSTCVQFNGVIKNVNFAMPQPKTGNTCTVQDIFWSTYIQFKSNNNLWSPGTEISYQPEAFQVTIDRQNKRIELHGRSGSEHSPDTLTFTAVFTLPDGSSTSADFIVRTNPSLISPTLNKPTFYTTTAYAYTIGAALNQDFLGEWSTSNPVHQPITYFSSVEVDKNQNYADILSEKNHVYKFGYKWISTNQNMAGTYKITVTAVSGCSSSSTGYTLTVNSSGPVGNCNDENLTFNTNAAPFNAPIIQKIYDTQQTLEWNETVIVRDLASQNCGLLDWESSPSDDTIYSVVNSLSADPRQINILQTDDDTKDGMSVTITITATRRDQPSISTSATITINFKNVCSDVSAMTITPPAPPVNDNYEIGDPMKTINFYNWAVVPSYCIPVLKVSSNVQPTPTEPSNIQIITSSNTPTASMTGTIQVFNDNFSLCTGTSTQFHYYVFIELKDGTQLNYGPYNIQSMLTITNPCGGSINLSSVVPSTATYTLNPAPNDITFNYADAVGTAGCPSMIFNVENASGDSIDATIFTFNQADGLTVSSTDRSKAGNFQLRLAVQYDGLYFSTAGQKDFTVEVIDPCKTATITLSPSHPFTDQDYLFGDAVPPISYDISQLYAHNAEIDCGGVELLMEHRKLPSVTYENINQSIFMLTATTLSKVVTTDASQIGVYEFRFKVKLTEYNPDVESDYHATTFTWSVSSCDHPNSLTSVPQTDPIEFTVTQANDLSYTLAEFVVDPSSCTIDYSVACLTCIEVVAYDSSTKTATWQPIDMTWTTENEPYYVDHNVVITGQTGNASQQELTKLRIHNPCVDPNFNQINVPAHQQVSYSVSSQKMSVDYTNGFSVLLPDQCGAITYTLAGLSAEVTQIAAQNVIEISTSDLTKVGSEQFITVSSQLAKYPGVVIGNDVNIVIQFTEPQTSPEEQQNTGGTQSKEIFQGVPENSSPIFVEEFQKLIKINIHFNEESPPSLNIGRLEDAEGDPFTVKFVGVELFPFMQPKLDQKGNVILDFDLEQGEWPKKPTNYTMELHVIENLPDEKNRTRIFNTKIIFVSKSNTESSKNTSEHSISEERLEEILSVWEAPAEQVSQPPSMEVDSISPFGVVEIVFSELLVVPKDYQKIHSRHRRQLAQNETQRDQDLPLEIKVVPNLSEMQIFMGFTWYIEDFTPDRMHIQLELDHADQVSLETLQKDSLKIKVIDPSKFISIKTNLPVDDGKDLSFKLPAQIKWNRKKEVKTMEAQAELVKNITTVTLGTSFVLSMILATSLSLIWSLINTLQLQTHFQLLNIRFPVNASVWHSILYELASFDIIPSEDLQELILSEVQELAEINENFKANETLSESTIDAGYEDADNLKNNIITWFFMGLGLFIGVLILLIFIICRKAKFVDRCTRAIMQKLFWNFQIQTLIETILESTIVSCIRLYAINSSNWWQSLNSVSAIGQIASASIFAFAIPFFLHYKREHLESILFIKRYGALTDMMHKKRTGSFFFYTCFIIRRISFAAVIIFLPPYPGLQLLVVCLQCVIILAYIGQTRPFEQVWRNRLELTNEIIILFCSYFLIMYSNGFLMMEILGLMVKDTKLQEILGWVHVGLLLLTITVNIVMIIVVKLRYIIWRLKLKFIKRSKILRYNKLQIDQRLREQFQKQQKEEEFKEEFEIGKANFKNVLTDSTQIDNLGNVEVKIKTQTKKQRKRNKARTGSLFKPSLKEDLTQEKVDCVQDI